MSRLSQASRTAELAGAPPLTDAVDASRSWPRLLSRKLAASYLSCSERQIDRLIATGAISVVRLPVRQNKKNGAVTAEANRRILIDRVELDALCVTHREQVDR